MTILLQKIPELRKRSYKSIKRSVKRFLSNARHFLIRQSSIPDQSFLDTSNFSWTEMLEKNADIIKQELDQVMAHRELLPKVYELQREQYRVSSDNKWKMFILFGWGNWFEEAEHMCPYTINMLQKIPGLRVAAFSILDAGANIPEHKGRIPGLLRGHLALIVPQDSNKCYLRIEEKICHWEEGKMLIFDDTYRHGVQNQTDQERIILLLHFDRPMNWLGRRVHQLIMLLIQQSPFVKDGVRNNNRWQDRFRKLTTKNS